MSGPYVVLAYVRALAQTLAALAGGRDSLGGLPVRTRRNGQLAVRVLPAGIYDRLLLGGYRAEVWMQAGVSVAELRSTCGRRLREAGSSRIALVLGAGNISSIAPLDVLYKLYADGDVVVLKLNPLNAYLQPVLERAFAPYVRRGCLRFAAGGADIGGYLAHHPAVGTVHMTGSAVAHDAIVFGGGEDGPRRKADAAAGARQADDQRARRRLADDRRARPLDGERPALPGRARRHPEAAQLRLQLRRRRRCWCWRPTGRRADRFLADLRDAMRRAPARPAYYPGADERQRRMLEEHPDAQLLGGEVPRTLDHRARPKRRDEPAFAREVFGPVLAVTRLPGAARRSSSTLPSRSPTTGSPGRSPPT